MLLDLLMLISYRSPHTSNYDIVLPASTRTARYRVDPEKATPLGSGWEYTRDNVNNDAIARFTMGRYNIYLA